MKARVKLLEDVCFIGQSESGHSVVMDGAPEAGGKNLGVRPMEMLLAGLGGCASYDVVLILKRGRHAVEGCSVTIEAERAEADPKVFTRIHMAFDVRGAGLPQAAVERAIALSHEKYCSASAMLGQSAEITTSLTLTDTSVTNL